MTGYFAKFLELEMVSAEQLCRREIAQARGAAAAQGTSRSGGQWLIFERIISESLTSFGERVGEKLTAFDPDHSPVKRSDFLKAKEHVQRFRQRCEEIHAELRSMENSTYPKNRKPFEGGALDRAEASILNNLDGQQAAFDSKRSFWKWAWGDLRKRIWAGALVLTGTVLGGFPFPFFKSLI